ncbi:hypothetical protein N7G274_004452 [Stereocaulon virgatum]|uniref:SRR1-like domain-containing protein n=1 Tax=Stereocaulon virgatum TaxID=373712 RepID=A0ABR4AC91_9LECA
MSVPGCEPTSKFLHPTVADGDANMAYNDHLQAGYQQLNANFQASTAKQVLRNNFENDLCRFGHHNINRIICLGVRRTHAFQQLVFIKSLQDILKHQHDIKDVYFEIDDTITTHEQSFLGSLGFTLLAANANEKDSIYAKITTRTLIFAPGINFNSLHTALRYSGFAVLICPDIDDTVAAMRRSDVIHTAPKKIIDLSRIQSAGFKRRMNAMATGLGEIGGMWCLGMSVHWMPAGEMTERRLVPLEWGQPMPER